MTKTLIKSRIFPNKNENKIQLELKNTKSNLPPNLQSFKQNFLSANGFIVYKSIDSSIIKQDYIKMYHYHQITPLSKSHQGIELFFFR